MRTKNVLLSLLIAAGMGLPAASFARADVSVGISIGPPPPPAVVYAPPPQPGHVWVPDRWVQTGPHWHHVRGYWKPGHQDHGRHRGHRD